MNKVCAIGPITKGIDIYHGNMISDVTKLKPAGIEYAMLKVYQNSEDAMFETRWKSMEAHGILRSAYDFFEPAHDPIAQAKATVELVGPLSPYDSIWLDLEKTGGESSAHVKNAAFAWLNEVEMLTGKTPGMYTGPSFANELGLDSRFARFPLWLAEYGVSCPKVPSPWKTWQFWQSSSKGVVPGIVGGCDVDVFQGTLDQLKAFLVGLKVAQVKAG